MRRQHLLVDGLSGRVLVRGIGQHLQGRRCLAIAILLQRSRQWASLLGGKVLVEAGLSYLCLRHLLLLALLFNLL